MQQTWIFTFKCQLSTTNQYNISREMHSFCRNAFMWEECYWISQLDFRGHGSLLQGLSSPPLPPYSLLGLCKLLRTFSNIPPTNVLISCIVYVQVRIYFFIFINMTVSEKHEVHIGTSFNNFTKVAHCLVFEPQDYVGWPA